MASPARLVNNGTGYDSDSTLSEVASQCPSPPPGYHQRFNWKYLPTPSQESSRKGTPGPDESSAMSSDKDGPPPRKRRRTSERAPRTTEYLDLRNSKVQDEEQQEQLDRLLNVLHKRQKIVVVAGAGISVSAGIPDFRSSTGLFTTLRSEHGLKGGSGKDLFDASVVYKDASSTSSFHDMVRSMSKLTKAAKPTPFHHMLATLAQQDRLLRLYSQNVDGIDTSLPPLATKVPLAKNRDTGKWPKTIQLHGGLDRMVCSKCHEVNEFNPDLFFGPVPPICNECEKLDHLRTEIAKKRSHGVGMLRPRMVLYNEHNPDDEAIGSVTREDLRKRPDAVIVVGTTLKVPGVKRIVREMCATVRNRKDGVAIWINNDPEPSGKEFDDCWDIVVRAKCDDVARLAALGQWDQQSDFREISADSMERSGRSTNIQVVVERQNATFKPPRAGQQAQHSPERPQSIPLELATPMSRSRTNSVACFTLDPSESDVPVESIETPSKKRVKAAPKAAPKAAAQKKLPNLFDNFKPGSSATTNEEPLKRRTVKYVKPANNAATKKTAAKSKAQPKAQPKAQQKPLGFRTTKTTAKSSASAGKQVKDVTHELHVVSPVDPRNNASLKTIISDSEEDRIADELAQHQLAKEQLLGAVS